MPTAWSSTTATVGQLLEEARRSRHRRQHHRSVYDRQWRGRILVARWRHVAVPRREELELGRRLPRSRHDPLAGRDQAGHRDQRDRVARRLGADFGGGGRRAERQGEAADWLPSGEARPSRSIWMATTCVPSLTVWATARARSFFYWTDDGNLAAVRYERLEASFPGSSGLKASRCGRNLWCRCACR